MSFEDTKISEFNQYLKSDKAPFIIYLEYIIESNNGYKNIPENSSAAKISEHIPSYLLMSTVSSFRSKEIKHYV